MATSRAGVAMLLAAGGVWAACGAGGCSKKSFLDPSVDGSGRWGRTPVSMPILTRIAAIEEEAGDIVEFSDPQPGDLVPLPTQYRLGQGDALRITLYDLIEANRAEVYEVEVDARGVIELPQLGRISVGGKTTEETVGVVQEAMKRFVTNPLASVVAVAQRQQTFNLIGAVDRPGPYFVPRANYRLLEAISAGGRYDNTADYVYVIREVSLTPQGAGDASSPDAPDRPRAAPEDLLKVIDDLAPPAPATPPPSPGAHSAQPAAFIAQPDGTPSNTGRAPVVDLPEEGRTRTAPDQNDATPGTTRWVFLNGKWTQVATQRPQGAAGDSLPEAEQDLVTQRVIRVPIKDLEAGKQSVNIVIRPGDVVRVPTPPFGTIYVGGQIQRPGTYSLPSTGGLTLQRLVHAAGGYAGIAVPSRIDLTRVVGKDREATIMLDGAAIANRTQPDVYLKPNDSVVVGTTFWALPLAIFRNGLRMSYGFGFVLDRNISNDLLGPPPVNQFGQ
ncbi:MAG: polysaccharide biosynthesis/export family protein [Planctomycetota bacterium]|nr:polysaccharide biosynthesis/export family protein [Planctomycetota bacterium]